MDNRLQFRYHEQVFDTRKAAREYIYTQIRFAEEGLAAEDPRYGFSLLSEPTVLLYKNITESDPTGEDDPHLMLVIGSKTNTDGVETGHAQYSENKFCIIDIDKTEQEIEDLAAEIEAIARSLTLVTLNTDTLNLYSEKTDDGTFLSGDVKVADSHIFDDVRYKNNLMVIPEGLFIYVNLEYDPENEQFTFTVSNADGTLTQTTVNFSDNYLISGYYDKTDESIHLQMRDGEEIVVDCEDLIAEWDVEGDASRTPVVLTREEVDYDHTDEHHHVEPWQDVLRGDVRIKDEEKILLPNGTYKYEKDPRSTNILDRTNDGRYLYVDGEASNIIYYMNGEKSTVKAAIDALEGRMDIAEEDIDNLETNLANEISRAKGAESALSQSIQDEVNRAKAVDSALTETINTERTRAMSAETALHAAINAETARAQEVEGELADAIRDSKLIFDDTTSIYFNIPYTENNIVKANVKLQDGDNIIKLGEGLYASVNLSYDPARNTIKLVTSNGEQEAIQLNTVGSLIDGMEYDPVNRALVITYHDAAGNVLHTSFPVNELFNDWIIQNPSEKSALELTKIINSGDTADVVYGRVLITDDHNGDGKPDQDSDNIIEIRNNGLYVDGTPISAASATAECVKTEIKSLERAVLGHIIAEECGIGYTYKPNNVATYIVSANSFNNADFILDQNLKRVEDDVQEISAETICIDGKTDKIYELLYGEGRSLPQCGEGASYQPYQGSCVISAASSFYQADELLDNQICHILTMWTSGQTCTTNADWIEDGMNRKMQVDVRLSHGSIATETDNDLTINNLEGAYIDPTTTEFTDTNALRIVCLDEDPSGVTSSIESKQNGIYLSNVWDCGLYYDEGTPADQEAKGKAQEAGYNTNYSTDDDSSARNYNYMNNVRQNDIPHN